MPDATSVMHQCPICERPCDCEDGQERIDLCDHCPEDDGKDHPLDDEEAQW